MTQIAENQRAAALMARFEAAGAVPVDCPVLLSAEVLLDLYGEDIRTRAYVTTDPARGEVMLRPDFTLPVVEKHMESGAEPARYTYSGAVFRRQEAFPDRASEYTQVGYEVFDRSAPAGGDAEVFALFADVLAPYALRPVTGDIGILAAAVLGLDTSARRRAALMRHIWRPKRFRSLLDRFAGRIPPPPTRTALLSAADPMAEADVIVGLRSREEIAQRIAALKADSEEPYLPQQQVDLIDALLQVSDTCPNALSKLRELAVDMPALVSAVDGFDARCTALADRGVDVDALSFEASYGRTSMEYYDGFVFGFVCDARPDWPAVATGGRYDALTRQLGRGREIPAVGGVLRPGLLLALDGASEGVA